MLHKFATHIAKRLLAYDAISKDDFELYEFAAFSFLFNLIPLVLSAVIGLTLKMFWKSILFIIPYVSIRTFSGGYHLKSSKACFVVTNLVLLLSLIITKRMIYIGASHAFLAAIIFSSLIIFFLSPIDSETRKLTVFESKAFKRIARVLVIAFFVLVLIHYWLGIFVVAYPVGMGIVLTAVLQLPCCILGNK